ncbi:fumarylacetoacetate hydrolase family protein [Sphingobium sp. EM0848]|uniref:fumarylacetoacetate hydrolase family protein n=1 Tax=Sphingobium sp. EM0848 TaxID=2743473 RepID=UPI00159C67EF|nr:fumarylacetoacetate hydrolase family protein [Sphingobium sp. EM0848]
MKLASLNEGGRDGRLLVVSADMRKAVRATGIAPTLQAALDDWADAEPALHALERALAEGRAEGAFDFDPAAALAPLPRAYQFLDGSAYYHHMSVVRAARGARPPEDFFEVPLMYQGLSDPILGPGQPLRLTEDEALGIDIEAEIAVITGDVPMGVTVEDAPGHVRLIVLLNDYSLRGVIPPEIGRGFGFLQGKCVNSMGPVAVTPDELGDAWNGRLLSGIYRIHINGRRLGELQPGIDASFDYAQLIAHAARTRELRAGTVIGAGALANADHARHGSGCIAEERAHEQLRNGAPTTPYLRFGDHVRLEMFDARDVSLFGAIDQRVERYVAA